MLDVAARPITSVPKAVVDAIIDSTCDPPNRFYRYPAARALLPILGRISWLTPNHVTYAHIAIGLAAAALVAFTQGRYWLLLAFALYEARMILDCFDGVLARARGSSSPFGRALDEIADSIAFVTLMCAMTHRLNDAGGTLLTCLTLTFGGLCANAWDFYKRKITFALRDGRDGVLEELRHKRALIESGKGTSVLAIWGVYFDCFQVLLCEVRPVKDDSVSVIRARANDPQFRRFASLLSLLSFDNGLGILHLGVLTGFFLESQIFALAYAVFMWLSTMIFARVVLRDYPRAASVERLT